MSTTYRTGLAVLALLSLGDLLAPLLTDGEHPPMSIALIGAALGAISLALVAVAWRRASLPVLGGLLLLRLLSALAALPAFVVEGVPGPARVLAGVAVAAFVAGSLLVLTGRRSAAAQVPA